MAMIDLEGYDTPTTGRRRPTTTAPTGYTMPRGTSPNATYPGRPPGVDRTFGSVDVPGYSPDPGDRPSGNGPFGRVGNTGITGGLDPTMWGAILRTSNGGIGAGGQGSTIPTGTGGGSRSSAFDYNAFRKSAEQIGGQYSGTLDDFIQHVFPQLQQQFPGIERFGSKGDKIKLPNGETIDAVISAGLGGRGYNWGIDSGGGGGYFDDPLMQQYLDFAKGAMERLSGPQGMNPVLQDAINKLNAVFGQRDPGYEAFADIAGRRLGQLRKPLFDMPAGPGTTQGVAPTMPTPSSPKPGADWVPTQDGQGWVPAGHPAAWDPSLAAGGPSSGPVATTPDAMRNSAILRTKFVEPLEQQRSAAQERAVARAATRGIGLGSGVLEDEARQIDTSFDQQLSQGYRDLMLQELEANEAREREAVGIGQALASLSGRNSGTQLSAAGQLANIGQGLQGQEIQNLLNAVGISQGMATMPFQAMNAAVTAMNATDSQRIPQMDTAPQQDALTPLMSIILGLMGQGEGVYGNTMGNESAYWAQLFQALPGLIGAFFPQARQASGGLDPGLPHA